VSYLAAAERTGEWLLATAERSPEGWSWPMQPGVSADVDPGVGWGTAGPAMFFVEAFRTTGDVRWLSAAREGVRWMEHHLGPSAEEWAGCGLLTGVGGWVVVLTELADTAGDEQARQLAGRVLDTVVAKASVTDTGVHWHDLTEMLWGTAGIGCLMLAPGAEPDGMELFTLGWCHGPPGLGWLFRQLELTTGEASWRTWLRRAARADLLSGIPARREPGFWDNVARCCGSAGVAEFFLDLHRLEGRPEDLAFAVTLVDDLLGRAIEDESGMRWSNYEFRRPEPDLPPETSYLQGAPGIGSTLLRLHRHLAGDPWTVRWPHAPSWGARR
jgi:lantibiotic modifying enzyme